MRFFFRTYGFGELNYNEWATMGDMYYYNGVSAEKILDFCENYRTLLHYAKKSVLAETPMEIAFFIAPIIWRSYYDMFELEEFLGTAKNEIIKNLWSASDKSSFYWLLCQLVDVSSLAGNAEFTLQLLELVHELFPCDFEQTIKERFLL